MSTTASTIIISSIIFCVCLIDLTCAVSRSVYRLKYFGTTPQLVTSDTLAWETFTGDEKQIKYAVEAGRYEEATGETQKFYVCRHQVEGILIPGNTEMEGDRMVCKLSVSDQITTRPKFDILVNKGNGAKLVWSNWTKYSGKTPLGAISASQHIDDAYVARYRIKHAHHGMHHSLGREFLIGRYERNSGLGKVVVIDERRVTEYNEGEILTETEPVRYELRLIKIDKWRRRVDFNESQLAATTLYNRDQEGTNLVETVVSYEFRKEEYWGKIDGVAIALPTDVYEGPYPSTISWGMKRSQTVIETKPISAQLPLGTAVNVTVSGNFTKMEAQYTANLIAYYADNSDGVTRKVTGNVQKAELIDVKIEYGPVYWTHNQTLFPTTTTTSTTTTTTTTTTPKSTTIKLNSAELGIINEKENEITPRQMQVQDHMKKETKEDSSAASSLRPLLVMLSVAGLLLSQN